MYFLFSRMTTVLLFTVLALSSGWLQAQTKLTLPQAVLLAQTNDPWLQGNTLRQSALENRSIASGSLPDPTVSIGLLNMPTNTWDFDQENMTQFKVGVAQMFPRGDSLALRQSQQKLESTKHPLFTEERKANLSVRVSQLFLDAYLAQNTIKLINGDKALFEQMVDVAEANYSSAIGNTRQQDVIRAQLELVQLDDRLTIQYQKLEMSIAGLSQWLHSQDNIDVVFNIDLDVQPSVARAFPWPMETKYFSRSKIAQQITDHPSILALDVEHRVAEKSVKLAKQRYKPQWGVNASYAHRDDTQTGVNRADFFSIGMTFDVPLFTGNRQDRQVSATIAEAEAVKTDKLLLVRKMVSNVEKEWRHLNRLTERQSLYQNKLLKQSRQQAEASLTAYTNDDGDFSEVVSAKIVELNARILALQIDIEVLKTIARLNYFFTQTNPSNSLTAKEIQ